MQIKKFVSLILFASLAGCASLPTSGPTGKQIRNSALAPDAGPPIQLVEVSAATDVPSAALAAPQTALQDLTPPPTDMVGPGDVLDINIYEAGVTLFSSSNAGGQANQAAASPGVQVQRLPPSRVDDDGDIVIPYAGKLHVLGHTISEVQTMIQRSLRGLSQNPRVLVTFNQAITNSVIVGGEVARPGRLVLQTNRETLSDVIALSGGYRGSAKDLTLRVVRRNDNVDIRVNDLTENPLLDVRAYPGDRFMVINNPRTFSVLGASGRIEQVAFPRSSVSLAEAVAAAGGANPGAGDAAAIFLFRYVKDEQGNEEPKVYHVNMMKAGAYFLTQRFYISDKDVLYFGNAGANQPTKLLQLVSMIFTPVITATAVFRKN
jgi:polysaccharide export outer membrane protein